MRGVIGVNTPFLPRGSFDPIAAMRTMFGEDMYIVYFQKPGVADAVLAKDVGKSFRFFMRKSRHEGGRTMPSCRRARNLALVKALQTDEGGWAGGRLCSTTKRCSSSSTPSPDRLHRRH